jgi:hypothetical protein
MKHPDLLLVPFLMFLDYFLTVWCSILSEKKYKDHFITQHYELNPLWQKQIAQKKWLNIRHIALVLLISAGLVYLLEFEPICDPIAEGILGSFLVSFGLINGRHLTNILLFRYLIRHPNEISGQVSMAHSMQLSISKYQLLGFAIPLLLVTIFSPSPFVIGGLFGTITIIGYHFRWIQRHKSNKEVWQPISENAVG